MAQGSTCRLLVDGLQIHVFVGILLDLGLLEPVDKGLGGPSHLAPRLLLAALLVPGEKDFLLEQVDVVECLEQARLRGVKKSNPEAQSLASQAASASNHRDRTLDTRPRPVRSAHLLDRVCVQHAVEDETEEVVTPAEGGVESVTLERAWRWAAGRCCALQLVLLGHGHERLGRVVGPDGPFDLGRDGKLLALALGPVVVIAVAVVVVVDAKRDAEAR
eukprot:scaffold7236_cov69-Phaeocystis_antarctica.AAC.1